LFRSQDRLGAFTALMMPFSVGSQLVGFGCIFWFRPTASSYLAGMCIGELAALALGLVLSRPRLLAFGNRSIVWSALYLTLPLVPNGIAYQTLNLGDRIVVQHKLGSFAVGRYQIAYNAAALVILALTLLNQAWLPKVFSIKDTTLRKVLLAELRDEVYLLLVPLVIGMSMVAPIVLRILAPASYHTGDLLLVVSLVAISAVPYAAFQSNTRTLTVFGRTRSLIWAAPVAAVVNIVLNIALVPVWGLDASATATLVGYAILAWITGFYSRRAARLSSTGAPVWIALTAAGAVSLASTFFPATALFVGLRLAMAVICAAWATRDVAVLVKGTKQPRRSRASRDKEVVVGH
jgi:O-antigen/teichoic acid export membrane protein